MPSGENGCALRERVVCQAMCPKPKACGIDFDLRQLEIFMRVVEQKSFSRAAEVLHLAQASVSERIANLERQVGIRLLERLGRKVSPTKAGEMLYRRALKHMEFKRQTCQELEAFLGVRRGEVQIGGSTIPGEYILPSILGRFHLQYPEITIQVHIGDTDLIAERVFEGVYELGVVGSRVAAKGLTHKELWQDRLVLVVPVNHKWIERASISVHELLDEPFIEREEGSGTRNIILDQLHKSGRGGVCEFNAVAQLGSSTAVKEGIRSGLGVSIISSRAVEVELASGIFKKIEVEGLNLARTFYLVRDRRRSLSPLGEALAEFLVADAGRGD